MKQVVGTLWYKVSAERYWLVYGDTGWIWGGTGWFLVSLVHYRAVMVDT